MKPLCNVSAHCGFSFLTLDCISMGPPAVVLQDLCSPSSVPDSADYDHHAAPAAGIGAHYPGRRSNADADAPAGEQAQNGRAHPDVRTSQASCALLLQVCWHNRLGNWRAQSAFCTSGSTASGYMAFSWHSSARHLLSTLMVQHLPPYQLKQKFHCAEPHPYLVLRSVALLCGAG